MQNPLSIDRWTDLTPLGAGAGGQVWRANGEGGPVALKTAATESQRETLRHEARVLRELQHPHVVRLIDFALDGSWLALELVNGQPLSDWIQGRSMEERTRICCEIADALAHLHERGVVHGDLKPDNVMVDASGAPRLLDLGGARLKGEPPRDFHGTPGFAAPEQLDGRVVGPAADIYALGAVFYEVFTGRGPFLSREPAALAWLPLSSLPEPPASLRPSIPADLNELLLQLLARAPNRRPGPAARISTLLRQSVVSPPAPALVGCSRAREQLRRAVVALACGQRGAIVVHGPPGSGRNTLIHEAISAARREGLPALIRPKEVPTHLEAPTLVTLDGSSPTAVTLASQVILARLPCLLLMHADSPLMELMALGAHHIKPPRLSPKEVALLLAAVGRDPDEADSLHSATGGLPGAVHGQLHSAVPDDLSPLQRQIIELIRAGIFGVLTLSQELQISAHGLLDAVDPMLDRGLLVESSDGSALYTRPLQPIATEE